jgi:hypothetical protein
VLKGDAADDVAELRLADTATTPTGVTIATYHTERSQA